RPGSSRLICATIAATSISPPGTRFPEADVEPPGRGLHRSLTFRPRWSRKLGREEARAAHREPPTRLVRRGVASPQRRLAGAHGPPHSFWAERSRRAEAHRGGAGDRLPRSRALHARAPDPRRDARGRAGLPRLPA